jgi:hypothetical protein
MADLGQSGQPKGEADALVALAAIWALSAATEATVCSVRGVPTLEFVIWAVNALNGPVRPPLVPMSKVSTKSRMLCNFDFAESGPGGLAGDVYHYQPRLPSQSFPASISSVTPAFMAVRVASEIIQERSRTRSISCIASCARLACRGGESTSIPLPGPQTPAASPPASRCRSRPAHRAYFASAC